jgi:hypothetical protein
VAIEFSKRLGACTYGNPFAALGVHDMRAGRIIRPFMPRASLPDPKGRSPYLGFR